MPERSKLRPDDTSMAPPGPCAACGKAQAAACRPSTALAAPMRVLERFGPQQSAVRWTVRTPAPATATAPANTPTPHPPHPPPAALVPHGPPTPAVVGCRHTRPRPVRPPPTALVDTGYCSHAEQTLSL